MGGYHQLTRERRYQIYGLKETCQALAKIAEVTGVHKSTISRELKRNTGGKGYRPKQAHTLAMKRRKIKAKKRQFIKEGIEQEIENPLKAGKGSGIVGEPDFI